MSTIKTLLRAMRLTNVTRHSMQSLARYFDYELVPNRSDPNETWLGLNKYPVRTIIDVGANDGTFARNLLNIFPDSKILCFEPAIEPYTKLVNHSSYDGERLKAFNVSLGSKKMSGILQVTKNATESSSLLSQTEAAKRTFPFIRETFTQETSVEPLDLFLSNQNIRVCSDIILKIDVQGYEMEVLKGAKETLRDVRAVMLEINFEKLYDCQPSFRDVFYFLDDYDFEFAGALGQCLAKDGRVLFSNMLFVRW